MFNPYLDRDRRKEPSRGEPLQQDLKVLPKAPQRFLVDPGEEGESSDSMQRDRKASRISYQRSRMEELPLPALRNAPPVAVVNNSVPTSSVLQTNSTLVPELRGQNLPALAAQEVAHTKDSKLHKAAADRYPQNGSGAQSGSEAEGGRRREHRHKTRNRLEDTSMQPLDIVSKLKESTNSDMRGEIRSPLQHPVEQGPAWPSVFPSAKATTVHGVQRDDTSIRQNLDIANTVTKTTRYADSDNAKDAKLSYRPLAEPIANQQATRNSPRRQSIVAGHLAAFPHTSTQTSEANTSLAREYVAKTPYHFSSSRPVLDQQMKVSSQHDAITRSAAEAHTLPHSVDQSHTSKSRAVSSGLQTQQPELIARPAPRISPIIFSSEMPKQYGGMSRSSSLQQLQASVDQQSKQREPLSSRAEGTKAEHARLLPLISASTSTAMFVDPRLQLESPLGQARHPLTTSHPQVRTGETPLMRPENVLDSRLGPTNLPSSNPPVQPSTGAQYREWGVTDSAKDPYATNIPAPLLNGKSTPSLQFDNQRRDRKVSQGATDMSTVVQVLHDRSTSAITRSPSVSQMVTEYENKLQATDYQSGSHPSRPIPTLDSAQQKSSSGIPPPKEAPVLQASISNPAPHNGDTRSYDRIKNSSRRLSVVPQGRTGSSESILRDESTHRIAGVTIPLQRSHTEQGSSTNNVSGQNVEIGQLHILPERNVKEPFISGHSDMKNHTVEYQGQSLSIVPIADDSRVPHRPPSRGPAPFQSVISNAVATGKTPQPVTLPYLGVEQKRSKTPSPKTRVLTANTAATDPHTSHQFLGYPSKGLAESQNNVRTKEHGSEITAGLYSKSRPAEILRSSSGQTSEVMQPPSVNHPKLAEILSTPLLRSTGNMLADNQLSNERRALSLRGEGDNTIPTNRSSPQTGISIDPSLTPRPRGSPLRIHQESTSSSRNSPTHRSLQEPSVRDTPRASPVMQNPQIGSGSSRSLKALQDPNVEMNNLRPNSIKEPSANYATVTTTLGYPSTTYPTQSHHKYPGVHTMNSNTQTTPAFDDHPTSRAYDSHAFLSPRGYALQAEAKDGSGRGSSDVPREKQASISPPISYQIDPYRPPIHPRYQSFSTANPSIPVNPVDSSSRLAQISTATHSVESRIASNLPDNSYTPSYKDENVHRKPSVESILKTPSSLAPSMLRPTISRASFAPSFSSEQERKKGGILGIFKSSKGTRDVSQKHQIWLPSSHTLDHMESQPKNDISQSEVKPQDHGALNHGPIHIPQDVERKATQLTRSKPPPPPINVNSAKRVFNPFSNLISKRNRTMSAASLEAQDGTATNTVGSPTASMHSQTPMPPPPPRIDPIVSTGKWIASESRTHTRDKPRRPRPGVVFDVPHEPKDDKETHRPRRPKKSSDGSRGRHESGHKREGQQHNENQIEIGDEQRKRDYNTNV
ncbi:hypothetical protein BDQ17DRAFT_1353412 [Cyathus striatus]|nr:hypothetical protein BDQ17DRAFT_1353412 [Cyathus striatus]